MPCILDSSQEGRIVSHIQAKTIAIPSSSIMGILHCLRLVLLNQRTNASHREESSMPLSPRNHQADIMYPCAAKMLMWNSIQIATSLQALTWAFLTSAHLTME